MSREFADEAQPGLTLLLDVQAKPYAVTDSKHTPFEWAVKVVASIATYAVGRGYPLYLLADDEALAVPSGQQSLDTLYPYLARVQPTGTRPLADIIHGRPLQAVLVTVLPWPDAQLADPLVRLRQRGVDVIAVVLAADSFTPTGPDAANLSDRLTRGGIDVVPVRFGRSLAEQLGGAQPARYERTP
jgi:uncharacterized protein (DUF58 family)